MIGAQQPAAAPPVERVFAHEDSGRPAVKRGEGSVAGLVPVEKRGGKGHRAKLFVARVHLFSGGHFAALDAGDPAEEFLGDLRDDRVTEAREPLDDDGAFV